MSAVESVPPQNLQVQVQELRNQLEKSLKTHQNIVDAQLSNFHAELDRLSTTTTAERESLESERTHLQATIRSLNVNIKELKSANRCLHALVTRLKVSFDFHCTFLVGIALTGTSSM